MFVMWSTVLHIILVGSTSVHFIFSTLKFFIIRNFVTNPLPTFDEEPLSSDISYILSVVILLLLLFLLFC